MHIGKAFAETPQDWLKLNTLPTYMYYN